MNSDLKKTYIRIILIGLEIMVGLSHYYTVVLIVFSVSHHHHYLHFLDR